MHIIKANLEQLANIAFLFDQYRVFYKQETNLKAATQFIKERLIKEQSVIFLAFVENNAAGFVQLYPSYSSVSLKPIYILNDLYVEKSYRRKGIGEALLVKAKTYCNMNAGKGLALETAVDNPAQKLYEKLGWKKDTTSFHYFWSSSIKKNINEN